MAALNIGVMAQN